MTDDAAKPADGAPLKPAQSPPVPTPKAAGAPPAPIPPKAPSAPGENLAVKPPVAAPAGSLRSGETVAAAIPPKTTAATAPTTPSAGPSIVRPATSAPTTSPPTTSQPAAPPPNRAEQSRPAAPVGAIPPRGASRGLAVLLALVCVLVLFGAGYLYWLSRVAAQELAGRLDSLDGSVAALDHRIGALEQQSGAQAGLDQRIAALEKRPAPPPIDLQPLTQRLAALENKPAPEAQLDAAGHAAVAAVAGRLDQLAARQDALGTREQGDLAKLTDQLAAQDNHAKAQDGQVTALAGRIDQFAARQDQIGTREQADVAKLTDQLAAQDSRVTAQDSKIAGASQASTKAGGDLTALATRAQRLSAIQGAAGALAAGRPLGPLPDAPPALAQFADKPPPTEADLRLSFAEAARNAHDAGLPPRDDAPFLTRIWARMQASVTVRQGDRVIVGDPISGVLAHAKSLLDAGDLAGAVGTLDELAGPAAAAMAPWRAQAQSLLDARAALLAMAHG